MLLTILRFAFFLSVGATFGIFFSFHNNSPQVKAVYLLDSNLSSFLSFIQNSTKIMKNTFPFKKILEYIDKILCPKNHTCNLCGKEVFSGNDFCDECNDMMKANDGIICQNCGRTTNIPTNRCYSCSGEWAVDKARSAFLYEDGAEMIIKKLKYGGKKYLAEILAPYLKNVYIKNLFAPDVITYVPMTRKKEKKRGFNQAKLLADNLAKIVDNRSIALLAKIKETEEQKQLDLKERQENLAKCFKLIDKNSVKGKKILLIDDVLTTGATAHVIAKELKRGGAESVYLLTVASVQRRLDSSGLVF